MKKLAKVLSTWCGPKPPWYGKFVHQMDGFETIDWECVPPFEGSQADGVRWLNQRVMERLGAPCRKREPAEGVSVEAICDLRPVLGEVFADRFAGYEWWGWCDLDVRFGRLDYYLPSLLDDSWDVVTFKGGYLAGCFTLLRNRPDVVSAFRASKIWRQVLADPRYYCWDETGGIVCGENFTDILQGAGLRVRFMPELYGYRSTREPNRHRMDEGGRLMTEREVLLCHFMDDVWPG